MEAQVSNLGVEMADGIGIRELDYTRWRQDPSVQDDPRFDAKQVSPLGDMHVLSAGIDWPAVIEAGEKFIQKGNHSACSCLWFQRFHILVKLPLAS